MRIAVLSSFNVDHLLPRLAKTLSIDVDRIRVGGFGRIAAEAVDPESAAFDPPPDAIVVIPAAEDVLPRTVAELAATIPTLLDRFPSATIYVVAFGVAHLANEHVLHPLSAHRGQAFIEEYLRRVRRLVDLSPRVVLVDYEWQVGARRHYDPRLWYLARMRLDFTGLDALADLIAVHVAANERPARKVLAIDLDGTLWGGVLGEDGPEGIVIGTDGVGLAFQDFQRELLAIRDTGVVLVAVSKNNQGEALQVLQDHPAMVIRHEHFADDRINWDDKAESIVSLAKQIGVGLDSFVFIDDSPVERDYVRSALPDVAVPEMPEDPALRPDWLRGLDYFRRISLTDADRMRADSYRANAARNRLRPMMSRAEFVKSLRQHVDIWPLDRYLLNRAAQLSQRTNQWNLTGRRYTPAQLDEMLADDAVEMYTVAVSDRFGDSGVTGFVVLRVHGWLEVDSFMLSCRVLGRDVETEVLDFIIRRARKLELKVMGIYNPTARNSVAANFYERHGFTRLAGNVRELDPMVPA